MRALALAVIAIAGCTAPRFVPVAAPAPEVAIDRIVLRWSNVYLVRDRGAYALVDAGSPVDRDALASALVARGVAPAAIRAVIITHAHADHAGLARWLQRAGVRVVLGAADARVAARGTNDPLPATGLLGGWLAPLFMFRYEPFTPDVAIDRERDLAALGLPDLRVVPVPGHTPGSIAVLAGQVVLAGDVMKGGYFAKLDVTRPSEHYYETDLAADHAAVRALLARGATTFLVGHGGPLARADVARWVANADEPSASRMASVELGVAGELGRADAPDGLSGVLRARFGLGRPFGYYGGFDLRGGGAGGADLEADAEALGFALRTPGGAFLGVAGGLGYRTFAGTGAARVPLELAAEIPAGPLHLLGRVALAWQLGGASDPHPAFGSADELTALAGIRLGRDRRWLRVRAGEGPYLAATYRDLDGVRLVGLVFGVQLWAAD